MRVYMELFRQRADVELKLQREREKGNCSNLKKKELVSCSLPVKEKFVILFGLFRLTVSSTEMEAAATDDIENKL